MMRWAVGIADGGEKEREREGGGQCNVEVPPQPKWSGKGVRMSHKRVSRLVCH